MEAKVRALADLLPRLAATAGGRFARAPATLLEAADVVLATGRAARATLHASYLHLQPAGTPESVVRLVSAAACSTGWHGG
jgi:Mg-chelatase subunit ChlI